MKRVILFNGPPLSGKDTAARFVNEAMFAIPGKMADPLKNAVCAFFNKTREEMEKIKDTQCPFAPPGVTWRAVLISFSEDWAKPLFGVQIFGHTSLALVESRRGWIVTVSDSGFAEEAMPYIHQYGSANILLVRIHRPGCDFSSDSRTYISLKEHGVREADLQNDGTLAEFQKKVLETVNDFIQATAAA